MYGSLDRFKPRTVMICSGDFGVLQFSVQMIKLVEFNFTFAIQLISPPLILYLPLYNLQGD